MSENSTIPGQQHALEVLRDHVEQIEKGVVDLRARLRHHKECADRLAEDIASMVRRHAAVNDFLREMEKLP